MRMKNALLAGLMMVFLAGMSAKATPVDAASQAATTSLNAGGKEKKSKASSKPSKTARNSAKDARRAMKMKEKQIMARAKVRMFFHNMFNTKFGKPVNFRKTRTRNRWKKGKLG